MAKAAEKSQLSFGWRVKAWWEGYDATDLARRLAERHAAEAEARAAADAKTKPAAPPNPVEEEVLTRRPHMPWDENRIEISELVWGEGYCGPGGPENVIAMSKLLTLSPEMSMLAIGAELGGPARTLANHFGVWISGYEAEEDLAKAGMAISERKGMGRKAPVMHYDFAAMAPFERRFDRAISKEYLFRIENLETLFKAVEESLKDDALFLITDYVLGDETAGFDAGVREWLQMEPTPVYARTADEVADHLQNNGFGIRVNEDITNHYQALVRQTWAKADEFATSLAKRGEDGRHLVNTLLREAELWTRRGTLFDSGKLRVQRILAHKKDVQKLMSDW